MHWCEIQKPTKASGTQWIGHHYKAVNILLKHYGTFMTHLEKFVNNDSHVEKHAQINAFLKWEYRKYGYLP